MVPNPGQSLRSPTGQTPVQTRHSQTGSPDSSKSRSVQADSLAFERQGLKKKGYSDKVLSIFLASRRQSTNKIYSQTWKRFSSWCLSKSIPTRHTKIKHILDFLQEGVDKGLSTNTIKRQLSTISSILGPRKYGSIASHHGFKRFIKGLKLLNPPTIHRFLTWDLHLVLKALMASPLNP